ncbi:MAG TPA: cytochrome C oxidase subunit IV family protein [Sulfuricella sp.]|nr:cytochrome C oxidase subunit IV family protein [Sulfuricella sp.]
MTRQKFIDRLWLLLLALTLGGALIGETAEPSFAITLIIVATMAFKGRIIIDHFMELKTANRTLRNLMRAYFYAVPLVIVLTSVFGDWLARLTAL